MKTGYTQPTDQLPGSRTFVKDPAPSTPTDDGHEKERVLPSPPWERSKPLPNGGIPQFGKPPGSDGALDEKPLSTERVRTKGTPGEDSPPDDSPARSTPVRRPGLTSAVKGPRFPGTHRQYEQGGKAKRYYEKYYRKNRNRILNRTKRWNRKWKNQMAHKQDKARRQEEPGRYERRPARVRDPADRSKEWREEHGQRKVADLGALPIIIHPSNVEGFLLDVGTSQITVSLGGVTKVYPLDVLFNHVGFVDDRDVDFVFDRLDWLFDHESEVKVAARYADFLYEKRGPDKEPGQNFDRASPSHHMWPEHDPTPGLDTGQVTDNPGSAKVIPEGHDFENKADRYLKEAAVRVAMRISEIQERTGPKVHNTSKGIRVKLTRVDTANNMWTFAVPGSQGTYKVRVKASPKGNVTDVNKMDIHVSCTCPFWRWQGPEHHAKQNDYLYGKPLGTASQPVMKDPDAQHWSCKHILAVLAKVSTFKMSINKASSIRLLADTMTYSGVVDYPMSIRVAMRYLERLHKG